MNTEQKVCPLAVMDQYVALVAHDWGDSSEMDEARAAVAELVEAAGLVANYQSSGDAVAEAATRRAQFVRLRAALAAFSEVRS